MDEQVTAQLVELLIALDEVKHHPDKAATRYEDTPAFRAFYDMLAKALKPVVDRSKKAD